MKVEELSKLVVERVNSVLTAFTKADASEKIERENWSLILKKEGLSYYTCNDKTYLSDRNHVILAPKGSCYTWSCEKEGTVLMIEFEANIECEDIFSFRINDSATFREIHKKMEVARILKPDFYEIEWRKCVYEILLFLLEQKFEPGYLMSGAMKKIQPAVEYIAANYRTNITNDILSEQCKISTVYFRKLFTSVFGVSPRIYLLQVRMDIAKQRLRCGAYQKIEDVASYVGYKDVYQFSKIFKKYCGITPKKYAAANQP